MPRSSSLEPSLPYTPFCERVRLSQAASTISDTRWAIGAAVLLGDGLADTAVGVVGRVALALVGARMTPTTHASIAERDEVGLNRRVATPHAGPPPPRQRVPRGGFPAL